MKNKFLKLFLAAGVAVTMGACKDFQEINQDPNAVPKDKMQIDYMLNSSIYLAQMDPDVAEREFILTWDRVSRYERAGGISVFGTNDDWWSAYWGMSYMSVWLRNATIAVQIGEEKVADGSIKKSEMNLMQMSRIWRAYLYSEYCDNFGPVPISEFDGTSVLMSDVKDIYAFILKELDEASVALDINEELTALQKKNEPMFAGDAAKWQKYANSMMLRYALRIGNQAMFEKAAARPLITAQDEIAAVQEKGGWDATTGVMTRSWNAQQMSLTYANITTGLGGVTLTQLAATPGTAANKLTPELIAMYSKDPQQYLGLRMANYIPTGYTNVGNAAYFMDYIPSKIDPRAMVNFSIPGHKDGTVQNYPYDNDNQIETRFPYANGDKKDGVTIPKTKDADTLVLRGQYSYLALAPGSFGDYGSNLASFSNLNFNWPTKSKKWRDNNNKRVFFGPWETYFLVAEAALKGWTVPMSDQAAYEAGIESSFAYFNISALAAGYLASEDYSRIGTSVSYTHVTEAASIQLQYVDLDSNLDAVTNANGTKTFKLKSAPTMETVTYNYPKGAYATNNDKLTKIITQKYLANSPWLPLEAWSDYRRLALPFMENPVAVVTLTNMPWYTKALSGEFSLQNIPQRITYPSGLVISNKASYDSGVEFLGAGGDKVGTPLSWAKK